MSDYLGRLAARSLEPARALKPRLASRFEPLFPSAPAVEREPDEPVSLAALVEETAAAPVRNPRSPGPPRRRDALPEVMEDEPSAPLRRHRVRQAPAVEEVEPAPERRPVSAVALTRVPSEVVPAQGTPVHRGLLRSDVPPNPAPREDQGKNLRSAEPLGRVVRAENAGPVRTAHPTETHIVPASSFSPRESGPGGEVPERTPFEDRQTSKGETISTILQPKITVIEREPFPSRREVSAPAPTIQVTIGRIEVRATQAPVKADRPRHSAPSALSLEEYLRGRSKGSKG